VRAHRLVPSTELVAATAAQLERRRELLQAGHEPIGWKLGMGDRERIGPVPDDLPARLQAAARRLHAAGERLRAGERVAA
jgi:hypothetical protein